MSTTLADIKKLIQNGKAKHAIESLLVISEQDNEFQTKISVISASFIDLENSEVIGGLTRDTIDAKKSELNKRLLDLVSSYENELPPEDGKEVIVKKSTIERLLKISEKTASRYLKFAITIFISGLLLLFAAEFINYNYEENSAGFISVSGIIVILASLPCLFVFYKDTKRATGFNELLSILSDEDHIKKPGYAYDIFQRLTQIKSI